MKEQRKHINLSRIMVFILSIAMLAGCPPGVSLADIPATLPKVKAASISNPRIVKDSSMNAGQKVTWDCVWFGSYPQSEVKVSGAKSVKAGKTLKLKAKVSATKKANTKLKWSSSNTKIATVSQKGVVKAGKAAKGKTVKITAMATDGSNKKSTIKIKIK